MKSGARSALRRAGRAQVAPQEAMYKRDDIAQTERE
jgi:hypothetical protein